MKKLNYLLALLFSILHQQTIFATAQISDILIYKGDTLEAFTNPLEEYPEIEKIRHNLFNNNGEIVSTDCWRGYIAEWTILENQLYLTAIYNCEKESAFLKENLKKHFGEKCLDGKVKADWFNSIIIIPKGKEILYIHSEYESLFEYEIHLKFKKGKFIQEKIYDNSKSKISSYNNDTTLFEFIYKNINWKNLPNLDRENKVIVRFSSNEMGKIDSIEVTTKIDDIFNIEAVRVVSLIPDWNIYYKLGKFIRKTVVLPINFNYKYRDKYF